MAVSETRLRLVVGWVASAALACAGWAGSQLDLSVSPVQVTAVAALIAVASGCPVLMRPGTQQAVSVTGTALLLAVLLLPPGWAVLCAAGGVLAGRLAIRRGLVKAAFAAGKDTLGAAVALAVAYQIGGPPDTALARGWPAVAVTLLVATVGYALIDELVGSAPIALATGTPWRRVVVRGLGLRTAGRLADIAMAGTVAAAVWLDGRLLVAAPLAVLAIHLGYTRRLRVLQERQLWAQLATAADAVTRSAAGGDLPAVLRTAAESADDLFPAAAVVEVRAAGQTGAAGSPATGSPAQVQVPLATEVDSCPPAGSLRLWLREPGSWSPREQQLLTHFAAACATAVRSCQRHAAAVAEAAGNAHDATHDPLTGLANRRLLQLRARELLTRRPRGGYVAMLLADLDGFKQVNDVFGHPAGDQLLVTAASRIVTAAGADALVARIGGDEFAVLMHGLATPAKATITAQRILKALTGPPVSLHGSCVQLAATAGLALAGDSLTDPDELLRRADAAMYQVKGAPSPLRLGSYARGHRIGIPTTARALTRAVASGQIQVRYQPVVELATGQVTAAEAVVCWRHPEYGDLAAEIWLTMVEQCGVLPELTDTILDQALQAAASWREQGFDLRPAINITPRNLTDPRFRDAVLARLRQAGLPPGGLIVELNRADTINHLEATRQGLRALRDAGVVIAIDDAPGTPTRLSTIATLRPDQIKVDVAGLGDLTAAAPLAVLCSIVELSHRLDSTVVAIGVEREDQRQILRQHGCGVGQGPMFGAALPVPELVRLLHRGYQGAPATLAAPLPGAASPVPAAAADHRLHGIRRGLSH